MLDSMMGGVESGFSGVFGGEKSWMVSAAPRVGAGPWVRTVYVHTETIDAVSVSFMLFF